MNILIVEGSSGAGVTGIREEGGAGYEASGVLHALQQREALLRIVSSLLENALKYEPEGGRVLLSLVCEKKNAVLSVQNFGSSIAEQDLPHVFDRFYRSDKSRGSKDGSFGLGLAITREMTERLGGKITARSSREEGTIFTVSFRI